MNYPVVMKKTALVALFILAVFCSYTLGRKQESWLVDFVTTQADERMKKAQEALAKCESKPVEHKYSTFQQGLTRYRFDEVSGNTCILLTTPENWKRPETKRENCVCIDYQKEGGEFLKSQGCFAGMESLFEPTKKR